MSTNKEKETQKAKYLECLQKMPRNLPSLEDKKQYNLNCYQKSIK